jgi:hypothetical protein
MTMLKITRISTVLLILMFNMFGCSDPSVFEPEVPETFNQTYKNPPLIPDMISVSQTIDGSKGGTIVLNGLYKNISGKVITVSAILNIPKDAFQGTETITISTDSALAALNFSPAMEFDNPLNLTLEYSGLDLKTLGLTSDIEFVFMGDDGIIEPTLNDGIKSQHSQGALKVINAKLTHFSKFGFTDVRFGYTRVNYNKYGVIIEK